MRWLVLVLSACSAAPRTAVSSHVEPAPPHLPRPITCDAVAAMLGKQLAGAKPVDRSSANKAPANPGDPGATVTQCDFTTSGTSGGLDAQRVHVAIKCHPTTEPCTPSWTTGLLDYNREVLHREADVTDVPVGKRACRVRYHNKPPAAPAVDELYAVHRTLACAIEVRGAGVDLPAIATTLDAAL